MRFVLISDRFYTTRGGVEYHATGIADELVRRGHTVDWIQRKDKVPRYLGNRADFVLVEGIERARLWQVYRKLGKLAKKKLVIFTHGSLMEFTKERELERSGFRPNPILHGAKKIIDIVLTLRIFRSSAALVVLSNTEAQDLITNYPQIEAKVFVIPNYIQINTNPEFAQVPDGDTASVEMPPFEFFFSLGRIEKRKNFGAALEAASAIGVGMVLAGKDNGDLHELKRMARHLNFSKFFYVGEVDDRAKYAYIRRSLGVVISSYLEGVPILALESLALGRPVVCTNLNYIDDWKGLLRCEPSAHSIATAVLKLRTKPPSLKSVIVPTASVAVDKLEGLLKSLGA